MLCAPPYFCFSLPTPTPNMGKKKEVFPLYLGKGDVMKITRRGEVFVCHWAWGA